MSILIADDNSRMRRMIRSLISDLAETIYECSDGAEAVVAYSQHRPDWVLMDVMMNHVDGLSATRQIRSLFPDARIIVVTNFDDEGIKAAAIQAGAQEYVVKKHLVEIRRILTGGNLCR